MAPHLRVLLVEDDDRARSALRLTLQDEGFQVLEAADGRAGLRHLTRGLTEGPGAGPDVVLLDLVLPDLDGLEVLRRIRKASDLPVIIVSGRSDDRDVVAGLHIGADDYVTKPVVAAVLTARIHALLRRTPLRAPGPDAALRFGDLVLRPERREVRKQDQILRLTKTEYRLLCELAACPGQIVTREQLLLRVWGYDYFGDTRLLDVHIRRLRAKIEDEPSDPRLITTVRGVGYTLQD
jgi:DNA-binding response OmpR family regulator